MRLIPLRLILIAGVAAFALPGAAQELTLPAVPVPPVEVIPPIEVLSPLIVPTDEGREPAFAGDAEATAPPIPEVWSPVPFDASGQSAYGLYLSGRLAAMRGERALAADLLTRTHALTPEQPVVADETFRAALFSGDVDAVVRLAPMAQDTPLLADIARFFRIVQSLKLNDAKRALADLRGQPFSDPYGAIGRYLLPATASAAGDWDAALAPVQAVAGDPAGLVLRHQRAQLLEARRRHDEAEVEYKALMAIPDGARLFRVDYGAFLERRGRRDAAAQAYRAALDGPGADASAVVALERLIRGERAPLLPTLQQIVADALDFAALEASDAAIQFERSSEDGASRFYSELSIMMLHLASALDNDDARDLRLGQSLARVAQSEAALAAFQEVGVDNPIHYASAQMGLASLLADTDRPDQALEALRRADVAFPDQPAVSLRLAGQLLALKRYDEGLNVLNRPSLNAYQSIEVRFLKGAALEALGRLDEAEAELWTALQAAPGNPVLLNHLGYLWVDSGRRVEQGAEMIARAFAADPRNGNIQDSLGWSQYRRGLYTEAVETLEQAVAKEPANAEINDHLGDAYWQVGRRREAGWQWSRVLTLDPDPERRTEAELKLMRGLTDVAFVAGSQP
ncbi:tetratricopeptide repeat protein [Brevundimonas sp.]|uniref:tetratricopeptide repeat protein n=1 Tax=Brevundimonas sp. TaxID=1871086 RepID=UPI003566350F